MEIPYEVVTEISKTLIAAVASLGIAAFGVEVAFKRFFAVRKANPEAAEIARTVREEREGRRAAVAEVLAAEAIGTGPTPERFREILETALAAIAQGESISRPVEQLVNNYHEQALNQAKVQFWFSIIAATIGFVWILYAGAGIQGTADTGMLVVAKVSKTFPGVVMDAVAFLFFRQAAATRERATELYDRLRKDKQLTESAAIVASIEDVRLRSAVKAQLSLHMSGLQPNAIDLSAFLTAPSAGSQVLDAPRSPLLVRQPDPKSAG